MLYTMTYYILYSVVRARDSGVEEPCWDDGLWSRIKTDNFADLVTVSNEMHETFTKSCALSGAPVLRKPEIYIAQYSDNNMMSPIYTGSYEELSTDKFTCQKQSGEDDEMYYFTCHRDDTK